MKRGDIVRIASEAVPLYHDDELSDYTIVEGGELVVVVEPNSESAAGRGGRPGAFSKVLHPTLGVRYVRKYRLEVL